VIALGAGVGADDEVRPCWWLDRLEPRLAELPSLETRLEPPPPPPTPLSVDRCEVDLFSCESREWFEPPASRLEDDAPLP
jgi:hypothetical protein